MQKCHAVKNLIFPICTFVFYAVINRWEICTFDQTKTALITFKTVYTSIRLYRGGGGERRKRKISIKRYGEL